MKECTNDYFEDDIPEDDLTDALERENAAILEIELEMENEPEVSRIPEASTRKKLKRELEQEAILFYLALAFFICGLRHARLNLRQQVAYAIVSLEVF